jgi:tetratricopeptide (TPR) repeat protein
MRAAALLCFCLLASTAAAQSSAGPPLDEALRQARLSQDPATLARVHEQRARWLAEAGVVGSALAEVNEGLLWARAAGEAEHVSGLLAIRATLASSAGLLAEAHADALAAREAAAKVSPRAEAAAMFALAQSYRSLSNFDESARLWTEVIARYQALGPPSGAVLATDARAHVWYELQRDDLVLADVSDAIAGYERLKQRPPAPLYALAAVSSARIPRIEDATRWLAEATRRVESAPPHEQVRALVLIGKAQLMLTDGDAAERSFQGVLVAGRARGSLEDEGQARLGLGRAALVRRDLEGAIPHLEAAVNITEQLRATDAVQQLRAAYLPRRVEAHEWLASSLMLLARSPTDQFTQDAFHVAERARVRALGDLTAEAQARRLEQPGAPRPRALRREEIAGRLGPGEAVLEFLVGEQDAFGWLLTRSELIGFRLPSPRSLDADVRTMLDLIQKDDRVGLRLLCERLTPSLLGPALSQLGGIRRLIVVPDGPLQRLPFAALMLPGAERVYLAQEVTTATMTSASLLGAIPAPADDRLPTVYVRADASESAIKAGSLRNYRVVYVEAVAAVNESSPRDSAIPTQKDDAGDGVLRTPEIANLPMDADLVVLAAARVEWGRILRGEGQLTLTRSFMEAGVRSVVAPLWQVEAWESGHLLRLLSTGLAGGVAPDDALRLAQLHMIRAGGSLAAPGVWAAFQSNGDSRQGVFPPPTPSWPAAAFALAAIAATVMLLRR